MTLNETQTTEIAEKLDRTVGRLSPQNQVIDGAVQQGTELVEKYLHDQNIITKDKQELANILEKIFNTATLETNAEAKIEKKIEHDFASRTDSSGHPVEPATASTPSPASPPVANAPSGTTLEPASSATQPQPEVSANPTSSPESAPPSSTTDKITLDKRRDDAGAKEFNEKIYAVADPALTSLMAEEGFKKSVIAVASAYNAATEENRWLRPPGRFEIDTQNKSLDLSNVTPEMLNDPKTKDTLNSIAVDLASGLRTMNPDTNSEEFKALEAIRQAKPSGDSAPTQAYVTAIRNGLNIFKADFQAKVNTDPSVFNEIVDTSKIQVNGKSYDTLSQAEQKKAIDEIKNKLFEGLSTENVINRGTSEALTLASNQPNVEPIRVGVKEAIPAKVNVDKLKEAVQKMINPSASSSSGESSTATRSEPSSPESSTSIPTNQVSSDLAQLARRFEPDSTDHLAVELSKDGQFIYLSNGKKYPTHVPEIDAASYFLTIAGMMLSQEEIKNARISSVYDVQGNANNTYAELANSANDKRKGIVYALTTTDGDHPVRASEVNAPVEGAVVSMNYVDDKGKIRLRNGIITKVNSDNTFEMATICNGSDNVYGIDNNPILIAAE